MPRPSTPTPFFIAAASFAFVCVSAAPLLAQTGFTNWESPHVSPLALTPGGAMLLAVNTPDNRLEIFDVLGANASAPHWLRSIPVGLDPVSVRARSDTEAWVVNHISDSISIIDLPSGRVVRTLLAGDEPTDVVFSNAGGFSRAFVTCSQLNQVRVYDLNSLAAAPTTLAINGEDPRMLAVSPDGTKIYAAIFESGNHTTALRQQDVSNVAGPYGGVNPPPNSGNAFSPPVAAGLPAAPPSGIIVRRDAAGVWRDVNTRDWSSFVTWNVADNDVAVIDAATLSITYSKSIMTTVMAIGVRPNGRVTAVGTEALNEIRFEPNVDAKFIRCEIGGFNPATPLIVAVADMNPHLLYTTTSVPQAIRDLSVGDPRAIVWHPTNNRAYVSGMGSNNIIITDENGTRYAEIPVGQGPTGLALSTDGTRLYCLNKFDSNISAIATATNAETARIPFYDPSPIAIKAGRPFLYDTHRTSGLGQASCASCHIDGRTDFLAWDLGNPAGSMRVVNQDCRQGPGQCDDWHPMKGPMVTQTFQGIIGNEPFHWRGDKENLAAFAPAFTGLQGMDAEPSAAELQQFTDFVATIRYNPNPNRNIDNTLPASMPTTNNTTGNPANGLNIYNTLPTVGGATCVVCHGPASGPGTIGQIDDPNLPLAPQSMKAVQLRGLWEKIGWARTLQNNAKGFGFNHHSEFDTLFTLLNAGFSFAPGAIGVQQRHDVEALLLCFPTETHPGVGQQITFDGSNNADAALVARLNTFTTLANAGSVGLIAKGRLAGGGGADRGWVLLAGSMQSDRTGESTTVTALRTGAASGAEITFTLVPIGTQVRIGIDRDADGFFDGDESRVCANPADPLSFPGSRGSIDADGDLTVAVADIFTFLNRWFAGDARSDFDGLGGLAVVDIFAFLNAWFLGC